MFRFYMVVSIVFFSSSFFLKKKRSLVSIHVSDYNWYCMACRFFFICVAFKKKESNVVLSLTLMSVLHMVPLFDEDERVEMQVMIYDLASPTCKRLNDWIFMKTWDECTYWSRMALLNFPATIGCVRVLIDLPQEDFVALYIMGWTRVHSFITMRHIKVTLSILSTCVSRMIRCDVLYLCRFSLLHQPFITYCIVHIHFMVSFCWHVCLVFSGFDVLYSCTLS